MKRIFRIGVALALSLLPGVALATSFTMTTETADSFGFLDTDSIDRTGEIAKVTAYQVFKDDLPLSDVRNGAEAPTKYAADAIEIWFQCRTRHYSIVRAFYYDSHGSLISSLDQALLADQPVPPQTGVEEQFDYACLGAKLKNKIDSFPPNETPLQTIIRVTRATMNDPRYNPL